MNHFFNLKKYKKFGSQNFDLYWPKKHLKYLNSDTLYNIFFKKNIKILKLLGTTMITLQNPQCEVWDCDKIIELVTKQTKKLDYNKLNIER